MSRHAHPSQRWGMLCALSLAFALVMVTGLAYYLWEAVPSHAVALEERSMPLPRSTACALSIANWFIRLVPFFVLLGIPLAVVALALFGVALARLGTATTLKAVSIIALCVGLAGAGAWGFVVYAMRAAHFDPASLGTGSMPVGPDNNALKLTRHCYDTARPQSLAA